jgi:hypothetical protein
VPPSAHCYLLVHTLRHFETRSLQELLSITVLSLQLRRTAVHASDKALSRFCDFCVAARRARSCCSTSSSETFVLRSLRKLYRTSQRWGAVTRPLPVFMMI